jgi:hypothetical protein
MVAAPTGALPDMNTVKQRLDAATAADMPWLRHDVGLTPPDGGPDVCGPVVYRAPTKPRRPQRRWMCRERNDLTI